MLFNEIINYLGGPLNFIFIGNLFQGEKSPKATGELEKNSGRITTELLVALVSRTSHLILNGLSIKACQ